MKLLISRGYDSILIVCDKFLEMLHFITTIEKIMVKGLVKLFRNNVWKLYGLLESVILDKESQFVERLIKELNEILGIEVKLSTAFYP